MLHQLVQYARDHALVVEPGFAPKSVRWVIIVNADGRLPDVLELGALNEKVNPGRLFPCCPNMAHTKMIGGTEGGELRSHFLIETVDVVAGYLKDNADEQSREKAARKHTYFIRLLHEASAVIPVLSSAAAVLEDATALEAIRDKLAAGHAKPTDKVTMEIDGHFPVEEDGWHDWWRAFHATLGKARSPKQQEQTMRCFVSGELVNPALRHSEKIKGLSDVGGSGKGDALISFDKEASCSYSLQESTNCAVSEEGVAAYVAALNDIITRHSHRLAGARVAHWFAHPVPPEDDLFAFLANPSPVQQDAAAQHAAAELLIAIERGEKTALLHNRYYALTLSGCSGRVMMRDWMEGTFSELAYKITRWFDDLAIVARDGNALAAPPKFMAVLGACVRDLKDLPSPLVTALWRAAVTGLPIPRQAMAQALARVRIDIINDQTMNHARMGLLKAYHMRTSQGESTMTPYLNPEHPAPAYQCGRLLAVLSSLQYRALGDVGAGVVQRFYAAASSTPALVLGRLTRTAQFHLNKLENGRGYFEAKIAEIWGQLGDAVPTTLTLEEQSLFALGYYQQMAFDRQKKVTTTTKEESI
jgi:CRISPR-associated protein Csd1